MSSRDLSAFIARVTAAQQEFVRMRDALVEVASGENIAPAHRKRCLAVATALINEMPTALAFARKAFSDEPSPSADALEKVVSDVERVIERTREAFWQVARDSLP